MPVTITPPAPAPAPDSPPAGAATPVVSNAPVPSPAEVAPPVPLNSGTNVSTSVGGNTAMPRVGFARHRIAGETILDRGDDADFVILGTFVGDHPQGARIARSDLPEHADIDRLVRLGVISVIEKPAAQPDAAADSEADSKPAKRGK